MAFNLTTPEQTEKYASEFRKDLEDFFTLLQFQINQYIDDNENITVTDIENYIEDLINGNQELFGEIQEEI